MAVEVYALDPARESLKDRKRAYELLRFVQGELGGEWELVTSTAKMRKSLFEARFNGRSVIGKVSPSERAKTAYGSLRALWDAGMRPPARFAVPEPIAWFPERNLLIQEKAPGKSILDVMKNGGGDTRFARDAADWLKALESSPPSSPVSHFDAEEAGRKVRDLSKAAEFERTEGMAAQVLSVLSRKVDNLRPSHGDFHPMNIYVSNERVTVIDLDTLALREREADIGYFLAQMAIFGIHLHNSLDETAGIRSAFLRRCADVDEQRTVAYMAWAFLQSLHYDLCILKIKNESAGLMLDAVERLTSTGSAESL